MGNSEHLLRATLQSIRDGVVTTDKAARILALNPAAEAMTGWSSAEAAGKSIDRVVELSEWRARENNLSNIDREEERPPDGGKLPPLNPVYIALRDGSPVHSPEHLLLVGRDGRRVAVHLTASPLQDSAGQIEGCVLALHDVSEAVHLAEQIAHNSQYDPLTGLPNRILFVDRLEQGTKLSDRNNDDLAVFSLNLDHFSQIKAEHGSALADRLLKEASYRMLAALRESDTVCRLHADEFVIMAPGIKSLADIEAVAAKLIEEMARPFVLDDHILHSSCSIGVSIYPRDARDAGTLLRRADGAMHQAKREGRNRYLFAKSEVSRAEPAL
jgi:diguanylate cyclase (GGDEF)-like protein